MKSILISIKPKYVAKILNGEKTIEIRKTCPAQLRGDTPVKPEPIDVYIYCTKDKEKLFQTWTDSNKYTSIKINTPLSLNGKVVAKFTLNKVEEIQSYCDEQYQEYVFKNENELLNKSCLNAEELGDYLKIYNNNDYEKNGYAWHIDNLVIFDKPKELSEFMKPNTPSYELAKPFAEMFGKPYSKEEYITQCKKFGYTLTKAPQSWCYVEVEK